MVNNMIKIICVGKIKEKYLNDLINDYMTRINKYHKISVIELKDSNINQSFKDYLDALNTENNSKIALIRNKYQYLKYENLVYKSMAGQYITK